METLISILNTDPTRDLNPKVICEMISIEEDIKLGQQNFTKP